MVGNKYPQLGFSLKKLLIDSPVFNYYFQIWNLTSDELLYTQNSHTELITKSLLFNEGACLASSSFDGNFKVIISYHYLTEISYIMLTSFLVCTEKYSPKPYNKGRACKIFILPVKLPV